MQKTFEAVYENGVLRPFVPLALANSQHVQITIAIAEPDTDVAAYFEAGEWESSKHDDISLHEVRAALTSIKGSLSDAVIDLREERY